MKKLIFLTIIFVFVILPILVVGAVIADVYLTVTGFDVNQVEVNVATPTVSLSPDNTTLNFSTNVSVFIPQAGFIPKAVTISFQLFQNTTALGDPSTITIALGEKVNNEINQSITLSQDMADTITNGSSIEITLKSSAIIAIFGFEIPYEIAIPDQTFSIP